MTHTRGPNENIQDYGKYVCHSVWVCLWMSKEVRFVQGSAVGVVLACNQFRASMLQLVALVLHDCNVFARLNRAKFGSSKLYSGRKHHRDADQGG